MEELGGENEKIMEEDNHPEISLNSVVGFTSTKTFKIRGEVNGNPVIVMIDPGATHNFIALHAVEKLGIDCSPTKAFGVSLGTGDLIQSNGECKSVVLLMQGLTVIENFLPIILGNSDLILGLQWLEKLGNMTINWKSQIISFKMGSEMVVLNEDASLGRSGIGLKAMMRTLRKERQGFLVEFNYLGALSDELAEEQVTGTVPEFLASVVN